MPPLDHVRSGALLLRARARRRPLMYAKTLDVMADVAATKAAYSREEPLAFLVSAMMAGAYVGIGILLIFTLGQQIDPAIRSLVMGACFGIALTLVIFAGSDLFTGHTLFMTVGLARGASGWAALTRNWALSWVGNLCGSVLLAIVFWLAGGGQILKEGADLIYNASAAKMSAPVVALVARAALCNWLVCLAIWTSARASSDTAKCILIWWCLFAFIACGFEHSVANMTVFAVALLGNHPPSVSLAGMGYNLLWVTLGNIVGGAGFVGLGYLAASRKGAVASADLAPIRAAAGAKA
jgi:nitrite transporter NirC